MAERIQAQAAEGRVIGYAEAVREALELALAGNPDVVVLGQGAQDPGAIFGTVRGLPERFGTARVFETPVSEEAMMGVCVGAAMSGLRPVYLHNRPDFLLLAFNQLVTHASKARYLDNGRTSVPLVVWSAIGRGWGSGAQHSQAIQGLLLGVPGLKIVMPSTPEDAKGLLLSAIHGEDPVLIFEHRWCMRKRGHVPAGDYRTPIGKGVYRRRGPDLTVVAASHAVDLAEEALELLSRDGIRADLIDLRSLQPLDEAIILESVRRTGRALVVDTGWARGGACAEIGFLIQEKAFDRLEAPVRRIGLPDAPAPAGHVLERAYYPDAEQVARAVRDLVGGRPSRASRSGRKEAPHAPSLSPDC